MRLLRFLTLSVDMSQNQAGFAIRKGRVSVDGITVTDPNFELAEDSEVVFDKNPVSIASHRYFMLNKPASYICATSDGDYPSALQLLKEVDDSSYFYFVNVLSPAASGLVLVSDDLRMTKRIKSKSQKIKKIYSLTTKNTISDEQLQRLVDNSRQPKVPIFDAEFDKVAEKTLVITQSRGGYQALEDRLAAANLEIQNLCLQQFGKMVLGDLAEGERIELAADQFKV